MILDYPGEWDVSHHNKREAGEGIVGEKVRGGRSRAYRMCLEGGGEGRKARFIMATRSWKRQVPQVSE